MLIAGPAKRCPLRSNATAKGTCAAFATLRDASTHWSHVACGPGSGTFACSKSVLLTYGPVTVSCVIIPKMPLSLGDDRIHGNVWPKLASQYFGSFTYGVMSR